MRRLSSRIATLEEAVAAQPLDHCVACGSGYVGSTVVSIELDGRRRYVCIRCLADRNHPAYRPRAFWRWMLEAI